MPFSSLFGGQIAFAKPLQRITHHIAFHTRHAAVVSHRLGPLKLDAAKPVLPGV